MLSDNEIIEVLLDILEGPNGGDFNDIYMRGDHNKNELRRLMMERNVTDEQISLIQSQHEVESSITFTEVLENLILALGYTGTFE